MNTEQFFLTTSTLDAPNCSIFGADGASIHGVII
jgi:hypothetical protein